MTPYLPDNFMTNYPVDQKQIQVDNGIYGVPWDTGPLGFIYREDLVKQAGIKTPIKTWDEFAAAEQYHKKFEVVSGEHAGRADGGSGSACSGRTGHARSRPIRRTSRPT